MPQKLRLNIKHMSLKMNKQARIELLSVRREKYASLVSRYKEARIIASIMQSAGYKNRKNVIRLLSGRKAPPGKEDFVLRQTHFLLHLPCQVISDY